MQSLNKNQQLGLDLATMHLSHDSLNTWFPEQYSPTNFLDFHHQPMSMDSEMMDMYPFVFPEMYPMQTDLFSMSSSSNMSPTSMWFPPYCPSMQPMPLVRAEIRERSDNWTSEETIAMLGILIANKSKFDNIRRHPELWHQLANELKLKGYPRSVEKCKNRWKVLVAKYKKSFNYVRDNHRHNAPHRPDNFEFFDQMSALLHAKFTKGPASLIRKFKISP